MQNEIMYNFIMIIFVLSFSHNIMIEGTRSE